MSASSSATPLLDAALSRLATHPATKTIPAQLDDPRYDRAFGEWVCDLARQACLAEGRTYESAVDAFAEACAELLSLQRRLERTGHYACASFDQARRHVYDDQRLMAEKYLITLLLSQALWRNHARHFELFRTRFCTGLPPTGRALEVPVGTGLFAAQFALMNPGWSVAGVDLAAASLDFARGLISRLGVSGVALAQRDVFELTDDQRYERIICGELLEHVDDPRALLRALSSRLSENGELFLTTAIWCESPDHVYLFESMTDLRAMLNEQFLIAEEWALPLEADASAETPRIPINFAGVLRARR